ncbi:unnamed protein product, partial [Staurois parvus]
YKWPPRSLLVRTPWECDPVPAVSSGTSVTQWNTDRCMGPLCEVPIM